MRFDFEFTSPVFVEVEESGTGVAMISGTLLAEGMSRNGNLYTVDEMENIAKTVKGAPIYFGTMTKMDSNTGLLTKNMHANVEPNLVGRIMECFYDKIAKKIKFIAHILNTEKYPHLVEEVKHGWGVSIGGKGIGRTLIDMAGRLITKILGLRVSHVQLLAPDVPRGQDAAQVESKEIKEVQESMLIVVEEKENESINIHLGHGIKGIEG